MPAKKAPMKKAAPAKKAVAKKVASARGDKDNANKVQRQKLDLARDWNQTGEGFSHQSGYHRQRATGRAAHGGKYLSENMAAERKMAGKRNMAKRGAKKK